MSRFVSWYVVELERLTKGRLPSSQVAETLGEVEAHLTDSAQELAPMCLHGEDPEALAIERFGPPRRLAFQLLTSQGRLPYWQTGKWLVVWLLAFLLADAGTAAVVHPLPLLPLVSLCSFALFVRVGFKARRVQATAIAAAAGIVLVVASFVLPSFVVFADGRPIPVRYLPHQLSSLQNGIKTNEKEGAWLDRGIAAFAHGRPAGIPAEFRSGNGFYSFAKSPPLQVVDSGVVVPLRWGPRASGDAFSRPPLSGYAGEPAYGWTTHTSFAEARDWWRGYAPQLRDDLQSVHDGLPGRMANLESAIAANPIGRWWRDLPWTCVAAGIIWLVGMAVHCASVLLGRLWLAFRVLGRQYA